MTAKQDILNAVRRNAPEPVPHPGLDGDWITFADRSRQFAEVLQSVGGTAVHVPDLHAIGGQLRQSPNWPSSPRICSLVPDAVASTVDLNDVDVPQDLHDLDVAVLPR